MRREAGGKGGLRAGLAAAALGVLSIAFALGLAEAALRLVPGLLPAGSYGGGIFHPELQMNVHGAPLLYNKVRRLTRIPNREGFLDVDHDRAKPRGVFRIGFLGDSFVESAQVPQETVFFRQLGSALGPGVETLGFGISGWGTAHALRAFRTFAEPYGLDAAIYMFVENDLGDQFYDLARRNGSKSATRPFAQLDDAAPRGFEERWFGRPGEEPLWWRFAKALQRRSVLAHVVEERIAVLRSHGVELRANRAAAEMTQTAGTVPRSTDLPGTWPAEWAVPAQELGRRVLAAFADEARERGVLFAVFYVPRSENQLRGALAADQTWKPWLERTCAELGITLIDPSAALRAALEAGEPMYDDHWTPAGHAVVAKVLDSFLQPRIAAAMEDQGAPVR